ncbi:hypothetical protein HGI30_09500 [Paenibacillus albicereus]|uniref:Uncharacterized protein n=1 Tax=Paenibacillus albicereus TaxID=2726185 RepID=A0A6H2GX94_9BACL|nr:hypothetical protein [Paenibacillus albicereus]QJC51758.1 hypothetical protein HGI30_09500 [Paenibacillus albicereus]
MWQVLWFFFNLAFVALLIWTMFMHRAYADALRRGDAPDRLRLLRRRRLLTACVAAGLFVAASASFLTNMRVNG